MKKLFDYLNPLTRLGSKKYSFWLPLIVNISIPFISEFYAYYIAENPEAVGAYIIFVNVASVIYFSFRDGTRGGLISSLTAVLYYFYIILTRGYSGERLLPAVETSGLLGVTFLLLSVIIGFLKQRIDTLIIREIESRQNAEEGRLRLQTILQQLPIGVLMADAKGKTLEGNKQLENILGRKINGNSAKYPDDRLIPKDWPITRALQKGETVFAEEMEFVKENQQKILLKVNAAPIKNRNGQVIAAVSILNDITRERDLENRKDDFINMASHELKTPITSMKIYIEILANMLKKNHDQKSFKIIQSIKSQTERLQELISDLLDVSRIQTGKLTFNKEQFVINELVEEAVEILQTTTTTHKIKLAKSSRVMVFADRYRIYQVLTNLITNAIKYSPDNSDIKLMIKTDNNKVVICVQDFGIGIAKSEQTRIFDRLYQVTDPTEKTFPGLGMGLYISHEIVKRHRGKLWVEGEKGKGSTFFFTLPFAKK